MPGGGGIGFQKLNGAGTVAHDQLIKLTEIENNTDEIEPLLKLMNANLHDLKSKFVAPDLKAWFKTLFPDLPVIPYYKTFTLANPSDAVPIIHLLGKRVFGECFLTLQLNEVATSDNSYVGANLEISVDGVNVYGIAAAVHGNDILQLPTNVGTFCGIVDKLALNKTGSSFCSAGAYVVIRGFEVPDEYVIADLADMPAEPVDNGSGGGGDPDLEDADVLYLTIAEIPDGVEYVNSDMAGVESFALYYLQGSNFLTPGDDFIYREDGGFELTGFPPLVYGQTLILIK